MFTDVYFTNRTPSTGNLVGLAFFQRQTAAPENASRIFQTIEYCPSGWSHLVRIPWCLSFRLVNSAGNVSDLRPLRTVYTEGKKNYLLSRDGILTLTQWYRNGQQHIEFEQLKGEPCCGVKLYRGDFLIAELYFNTNTVCFQVDSTINLCHFYSGKPGDPVPAAIRANVKNEFTFDLTGLKEVGLQFNANAPHPITFGKITHW